MGKVLIVPTNTVKEGSTCVLTYTIQDPDGVAVPGANVSVGTLDMRQESDGTSIGATARDVASDFGSGGVFRYVVPITDNDILLTTPPAGDRWENHIATVAATYTSGSETHTDVQNFLIRVEENPMVT